MNPETVLAYHAHNNLQQAFGNAEALVEMNLKRDLVILLIIVREFMNGIVWISTS